jgi:putative flippase GtrA
MDNEKKKESIRIVKFFIFSVSAGVIEIVSFALLNELTNWTYWPCYLIALTLSVLWNFTLNRNFTFKSASNVPVAMVKVAIFYCIFTPVTTLLGNYLVEDLLWNEYLVTGINMVLNLITEYLYDRFFVFGKSIDTNKHANSNQSNQTK